MQDQKAPLTKQTLDTVDEAARLYQSEVGGSDVPTRDTDFNAVP